MCGLQRVHMQGRESKMQGALGRGIEERRACISMGGSDWRGGLKAQTREV